MKLIGLFVAVITLLQIGNLNASPNNLVSLYRLYNSKVGDHFYTSNLDEAMNAVHTLGYNNEGQAGFVATSETECQLKPIFRLYNQRSNDHFYTINDSEASNAALIGYQREGIAFYCAANAAECGPTVAFYRYVIGSDHFYTTNIDEGFNVVKNGGKYEGIICHIWA